MSFTTHARTERQAELRVCSRCIMDTTDPEIHFDSEGVCNHCHLFDRLAAHELRSTADSAALLERIVDRIRRQGRGRDYDSIIGVSGGVDSTYVAYLTQRLGLRPLAVHLDNGWDSELAVSNIEKVLKKLKIDLYTEVLDWEEFRDLQLSFLRASVPDGEIPTDHAIGATIYRIAAQERIPFVISGFNLVTEGVLPPSWTYGVWDWKYIRSVHRRHGSQLLRRFPHYSLSRLFFYSSVLRIRSVRILNYVPYVQSEVMRVLQEELGWIYYGGKHFESIYTRFFQGYILPRKFNIDKRKAHLSSLVCAGQITREAALSKLATDSYPSYREGEDKMYVMKKLGLDAEAFEQLMALPVRSHRDFPNAERLLERVKRTVRVAQRFGVLPAGSGVPL